MRSKASRVKQWEDDGKEKAGKGLGSAEADLQAQLVLHPQRLQRGDVVLERAV